MRQLFSFRFNEEEMSMLERKARVHGMNKSEFIRYLIDKENPTIKQRATYTIKNLFGGINAN